MEDLLRVKTEEILNSLRDGVYVCDSERRITYWNKSAERITGWTAQDVVGSHCYDGILCHNDKDGHQLCGEEYCPLHRAMVTGTSSPSPLLVYARGKNGGRVPMFVSVAPIQDADGNVIGGVETFLDASANVHDLERAKAIQELSLTHDLPQDPRLTFTTHYIPHDIIGGDYYAISKLDDNCYGLILADVSGHGIAAALYTSHLNQLWNRFVHFTRQPAILVDRLNKELTRIVKDDSSFATAICGLIDLKNRVFRFTSAGGPQILLTHADGTFECLEKPCLPLAVMADAPYEEASVPLASSDRLLFFSDGAVEVMNADQRLLGVEGLIGLLRKQGYPRETIRMDVLEEDLLKYSNAIRLDDDLTLIDIQFDTF